MSRTVSLLAGTLSGQPASLVVKTGAQQGAADILIGAALPAQFLFGSLRGLRVLRSLPLRSSIRETCRPFGVARLVGRQEVGGSHPPGDVSELQDNRHNKGTRADLSCLTRQRALRR